MNAAQENLRRTLLDSAAKLNALARAAADSIESIAQRGASLADNIEKLAALLRSIHPAQLSDDEREAMQSAAAPLVVQLDEAAAHLERGRLALVTTSNLLWATCPRGKGTAPQ
jgi:hypothetical protein